MISIIITCHRSGASVSQSHFNTVFLAQRVTLLRTLQRMVNNPSTAEDLLQETYLRVTRALSEHPVDHLEPFVFQTARNLALDSSARAPYPVAHPDGRCAVGCDAECRRAPEYGGRRRPR